MSAARAALRASANFFYARHPIRNKIREFFALEITGVVPTP